MQNDLIHAWGLDIRLGYCAQAINSLNYSLVLLLLFDDNHRLLLAFPQGDRTKTIGVVDDEYIVHYGLPTLGEQNKVVILSISPSIIDLVLSLSNACCGFYHSYCRSNQHQPQIILKKIRYLHYQSSTHTHTHILIESRERESC